LALLAIGTPLGSGCNVARASPAPASLHRHQQNHDYHRDKQRMQNADLVGHEKFINENLCECRIDERWQYKEKTGSDSESDSNFNAIPAPALKLRSVADRSWPFRPTRVLPQSLSGPQPGQIAVPTRDRLAGSAYLCEAFRGSAQAALMLFLGVQRHKFPGGRS
jgi:hypothetical protein